MKTLLSLCTLAAALLVGGCYSEPVPRVKYPVTYNVQVGNTRVTSDYGPQNLNTQAVQQVSVEAGRPIYYQVVSPFEVSVVVSESSSPGVKEQVSQMQGTTFTAMLTPKTPLLEFTFAAAHTNSGGTLQFTLSDQPIVQ
ncbi:MAG TPA: hypothetical protein VFT72_01040 [Opitutaceae bacterium]|nr:hypothetical protein [Opitutaceae bacterium]